MRIQDTPFSERPRERCLSQGPACLSLRELLALLMGSGPQGLGCLGIAGSLLDLPGSGLSEPEKEIAFFTSMEGMGSSHLQGLPGLGSASRAKLLAAFELGRRYALYREQMKRPQGQAFPPRDYPDQAIGRIPSWLRCEPQEWLGFVPLHRSGQVGGFCMIERGVRTHVNVDPLELFARVLALRPRAFFLFHNHPSGDLTPSPADFDLTQAVKEVADRLSVRLLGHGIVTSQGERWIVI